MRSGALTAVVTYAELYLASSDQWQDLFNGTDCELTFCDSNGEVSISCNSSKVYFNVSKSGAGGDGSVYVSVSHSDCAEAFKECKQYLTTIVPYEEE